MNNIDYKNVSLSFKDGKVKGWNIKSLQAEKIGKKGDRYRKKEKARVNAYYKPIDERTSTEGKEWKKNVRTWVSNYRQRMKADNDNIDENIDDVGVQAMPVDVDVHTDG